MPRIGRNQPCPCGSGHKYKKCCGKNPAPAVAETPAGRVRELDEETIDEIVRYADAALADIGDRLGLVIGVRQATFSAVNAKVELEVATVRDDGIVMDKLAEAFVDRCHEFGLEPEDLGREFQCGGDTLRILGLRPRAKYPVICAQIDPPTPEPRHVRMSAVAVRNHLSAPPPNRGLRLLPPREASADSE